MVMLCKNIYDLPSSIKVLFAVLILTSSNIILTLKLLHSNKNCSSESKENIISTSEQEPVPEALVVVHSPSIAPAPTLPPPPAPRIPPDEDYAPKLVMNPPIESDFDGGGGAAMDFSNLNLSIGRWDNRRLYKIYDFALVGDRFGTLSEKYLVSLATQTSIERLHFLSQVAKHWTGPISVAVFVSGNDEFRILQHYVTFLRLCFDYIRDNVSWHIAIPKDRIPNKLKLDSTQSFECERPEQILKGLLATRSLETIKWRLKNVYPQNHMRNLARKGCQTDQVFLTDVDIIPSYNITDSLDTFLRLAKCPSVKCAYVIPTFELDVRVAFPKSKKDLLRLVKKGLARPFHEKVFIYNQFATNFTRWARDKNDSPDAHISHDVTNFEFLYEPFYVASDLVPIHDERFRGYGFTRNSQVYEMYIAGYQFKVMSPIFTIHWGLQQKKTRPAWREQQNNLNRKQFELFKKEILLRYSSTKKL